MDPKFADALNAKGISLTRKGNRVRFEPFGVERADTFYAEAVGMFDRAISVDPYNAGFRINQALLYKVMNRDDDARRAYSEAVNLDQALPGEFDDLFPQ
jgi:tetratricopeptide (TPR) repeat protein